MVEIPHLFLNLHGVPSERPPEGGEPAFGFEPIRGWCLLQDDLAYDVEAACIDIHEDLSVAIFGDRRLYHRLLPNVPEFVFFAGLNSESSVSRDRFEEILTEMAGCPYLNHFLYLNDAARLVSAIQTCDMEIGRLLGEFYRNLNLERHTPPPSVPLEDGLRWTSSATVTSLTGTMNFIFIRMHSLLDYLTKLFHEIEHLAGCGKTLPPDVRS